MGRNFLVVDFSPSSFFKLINFLKLEDNYFAILWWFLPYIDLNHPCVHLCPPSWSPQPLSPHHLSGLSQSTSFEFPASCIKFDLVIYITYGNIRVSHSLKSSHPRLLPHSTKVCSLHLCLFCCFAHRIIVTIF